MKGEGKGHKVWEVPANASNLQHTVREPGECSFLAGHIAVLNNTGILLLWQKREMAVGNVQCPQQKAANSVDLSLHLEETAVLYMFTVFPFTIFRSNTNEVVLYIMFYNSYFPFNHIISIFSVNIQ